MNKGENDNKGKRIEWIDIEKAIAIMLTIVGHSAGASKRGIIILGIIYSFHMPLFFVLSGLTHKCSSDKDILKENMIASAKHLLGSAIIVLIIRAIICFMHDRETFTLRNIFSLIESLIWASGIDVNMGGQIYKSIGMLWFVFVIFEGKIIFDYLVLSTNKDKERLRLLIIMLGVVGVIFGRIQWMPFSLDVSLAVLPFFYWGHYLQEQGYIYNIDQQKSRYLVMRCFAYAVAWGILLFFTRYNWFDYTYFELANRVYPFYPLCLIVAILGTMSLSYLSMIISKIPIMCKALGIMGQNSLYILYVHFLDMYWEKLWIVSGRPFHTTIKRILVDIIIVCLMLFIKKMIRYMKAKFTRS